MAITVKHTKVSTIPDGDDSSLIRPSDWNADHTLVGLGTAAELDAGVPNGVATLDGTGKVPISELPAAVIGALNYQGTWNASTNTPTLTSSVGTKGYYYVVNVAGSTNLDGITDWQIGDWVVFNGTVWQKVDNTDAGGDVVGPTSATDNAIARFDTTTGKLIQNSTVTIDDNGNIINANSLGLDTTPATVPTTVGTMSWDDGDGVPQVLLKGGNTTLQVGTQEYVRVFNDSGTTLTKGQAVYISGAQGNRVAVKLARADVEATSFGTIGLVAETMANGAEGFIIVSGALYKLNTLGLTAGATVYLSPTTAGAITTTKPQAPDQLVVIGWVERVDNNVGSIYVKIDNGYELDELHDVRITSPQSGNLLIYDASTSPIGVWKNANLTDGTGITITEGAGSVTIANAGVTALSAGTGISVSGSTGNVTVTNTAPDRTVAIASGTGISVTGTYPNFTVTNAGVTSFSAGTTGLTPSTGTTGAVTLAGTLAIANGGTGAATAPNARTNLGATTVGSNMFTLTNPSAITFPRFNADNTVSALDAATFRTAIGAGTGSGTVTSVTGTSPVVSSGGTAPAISLASGYGDTQNPYASKTANFFLAAPNGTAGAPTFRAIVAADIPTLNQNTTGTASNVTGTVAIANGGTGQTTQQAAINALAGAVTSAQFLRGNGTNVVMSAIQASDVPTLNQNTTGTASNVTGTVAIGNGGTGATTAPNARTNLGATTVGSNLFTLTNPSAITFPRINADNTVSTLDAATFRSAIGAGTGSGTVTSVAALTLGTTGTDLSSTVANGTTTPVITLNVPTASATNRGALSSADWTTFNNKAPAVTYTTNYVPFGQGTTTPNQSANFTYVTGTGSLTAPQMVASNGIVVNNRTISTSYSIPSGYSATSAGPITVASGVSVTVPSGGKWVVL